MNFTKEQIINFYTLVSKDKGYSPIAGKMLGLFLVSNQKYFTFEELMEELSISKSATSKTLKFLIEIGEIDFIKSKENKRKRLFYFNIKGATNRYKRKIKEYTVQTQLLEKTLELRDDSNLELNDFIKNRILFAKEVIAILEPRINQLNKI